MPRLLEVADLCSRTVSDTANRLLKRTDSEGSSSAAEKKSSAVPLFRSGHMSAICARLGSKGKVGVQRGRKTAGCPSFLPLAAGAALSRAPQSATPRCISAENSPPVRVNRLRGSNTPLSRCRKRCRPEKDEHAYAVRVPQPFGARNARPLCCFRQK